MQSIKVISFLLILVFAFSFSSFAQEKKMEMKKKVDSTDIKMKKSSEALNKKLENNKTQVTDNKPVNSVCPVSGEEIDPEITAVYKDKTYAVCCKSCLKKFNKDPEKYISKLSEDGKSLKKIN